MDRRSRAAPHGFSGVPGAVHHTFRRGEFILEAGCAPETVHIIGRGQVRVFLLDEDGRETTTSILGPTHLVGIAPLLGRDEPDAFAQALTTVETWAIPISFVRQRLGNDRSLRGLMLGSLVQRFALAQGLLRDVLLLPVAQRVADVQVRLACLLGAQPSLTRAALAALVQARPETLARHRGTEHYPTEAVLEPAEPNAVDSTHQAFRADETVLAATLPAGQTGVVLAGQLQLSFTGSTGRAVAFDTVEPGDLLGIDTLLGLPPVGLRAVALTDGAVRFLSAHDLLMLLDEPAASSKLMTRFGLRLERLEQRLARLTARSVSQQLMDLLAELARAQTSTPSAPSAVSPIEWSHAQLARHMGVCRETVTRALATLARAGAIERAGRRIVVTSSRPAVGSASGDESGRHACRLCGLPVGPAELVCRACADRLELELELDPEASCQDCGRHTELCGVQPCDAPELDRSQPVEKMRMTWLPIDQIDEPEPGQNSRARYSDGSIRQLAASIGKHGLLQPVCVRPTGDRYRLVFGVRRLRAARRAGLVDVPCTIQVADDEHAFLLNTLENLHREQLSGAERIRAIERLAATGLGVREISRRTGFNPSTISRWLRIEGSAELKQALSTDALDIGRAKILVEAPRSMLVELINQAPRLTPDQLRARVKSLKAATDEPRRTQVSGECLRQALTFLRSVRGPADADLLRQVRREVDRLAQV